MPMTEPVLTKRIPSWPWSDPKGRHIVGYDEFVNTGGYNALDKALSMQPSEIVSLVKDANLRGRGGAGFSAGLKWTFLPPVDGGRRYLCIRCLKASQSHASRVNSTLRTSSFAVSITIKRR